MNCAIVKYGEPFYDTNTSVGVKVRYVVISNSCNTFHGFKSNQYVQCVITLICQE